MLKILCRNSDVRYLPCGATIYLRSGNIDYYDFSISSHFMLCRRKARNALRRLLSNLRTAEVAAEKEGGTSP